MKIGKSYILLLLIILVCASPAAAQSNTSLGELTKLMDSARVHEADVFAPKVFLKADKKYMQAKEAMDRGKKQSVINSYVAGAREYIENALKASEVCKLTLKDYLPPRDKARAVQAYMRVPKIYEKAELQFKKATENIESGNVKNGLKYADKASSMFATAEMEAIRDEILGNANKLIAKALADGAEKYALATLDKARSAYNKADAILVNDRYERDESLKEAALSEYEARHSSNITQNVRSLARNDQAWEKLMLVYEIQMNRVGNVFGLEFLPFDNGPFEAADTLIARVQSQQKNNTSLDITIDKVAELNNKTIARLASEQIEDDPVVLAEYLDSLVGDLLEEKRGLAEEMMTEKKKLEELEKTHEEVAAELDIRQEREKKFRKAKQVLNPSEGEILFNSSNDIVLRLSGLSFDVSKSNIKDEHIPLLKKVIEIINMFPSSKLIVEGHTDDQGEPSANTQLSDKRAYEILKYLRQTLLISSENIRSIGYGAEKPVASNKTVDGRAKNRRIDIIIMN